MTQSRIAKTAGFTLVEVLIVVAILGILAAIVIFYVRDGSEDARKAAFVSDVKTYENAAQRYTLSTGLLLEDSASGALPTGWGPFVNAGKWTNGTPIGGMWDFELNSFGITSAFGVHFNGAPNPGDAYMQDIDAILDDGDLTTGGFQKISGDRYYFILLP